MPQNLARRLTRLERATQRHFAYPPPSLLFIKEGETDADAIMRACGPTGLPDRPPGAAPHILIRLVKPADHSR